jgi:hypothetical protein
MKKVINAVLAVCVVLLAIICWRSIQDDINFDKEVAYRESQVKARLLQIKDAEEAYKQQYGKEISLLKKGISLRNITAITGTSVNTLRRLKAIVG